MFGDGCSSDFPFAAYVSKTITLEPRAGNPPPRLWEAAAGLINSIGLPNKGLDGYLREDLPQLAELTPRAGAGGGRRRAADHERDGLERRGARAAASRPATRGRRSPRSSSTSPARTSRPASTSAPTRASCEQVVRAVRGRTAKPLIVKLTPNTADVAACAQAAEAGRRRRGLADQHAARDGARAARARTRLASAWLGGGTGGLSGPAIRAVALAQVAAVAARVAIPVIGMGGVQSAAHARDCSTSARRSSRSAPRASATPPPARGSRELRRMQRCCPSRAGRLRVLSAVAPCV